MMLRILVVALLLLTSRPLVAQESSREAERKVRQKYFQREAAAADSNYVGPDDHYLSIHLGGFVGSDAYHWGDLPHTTDPGKLTIGLSYKIGMINDLADWLIRADFLSYQTMEGRPVQFVISPVLAFPDAASRFPLYFGIGLGPGFFLKQVTTESFLALNYSVLAGARLFNVAGATGFFIEGGVKNHFHLLSDGQFNGYFISTGAVFVF